MKIIDEARRILSMPSKDFESDTIIHEFGNKYKGSILRINGAYKRFEKLLYGANGEDILLQTLDNKGRNANIKEISQPIEEVHPKTGLYESKYGLVYLNRLPARQWIKSFAIQKNYTYRFLKENAMNGGAFDSIEGILGDDVLFSPETIIFRDDVFLHWKKVGTFDPKTKTIHLKQIRFQQEIEELWPQYRITLEQKPLPKQQEDGLILDF